jgi:hypothetical protein
MRDHSPFVHTKREHDNFDVELLLLFLDEIRALQCHPIPEASLQSPSIRADQAQEELAQLPALESHEQVFIFPSALDSANIRASGPSYETARYSFHPNLMDCRCQVVR